MSKSDLWINVVLFIFILIHLSVFIAGLKTHKLLHYVSLLNGVSGLILVTYWIQNELRITQHFLETREMIFLGLEVFVVGISFYSFLTTHLNYWLKVTQYVIFSIHFVSLVLLLIFMLTFKMNKLI